MDALSMVFGEGDGLAWWQAAARAFVIFVAAWAMLRLAGRRAFAQRSSFDLCITLLLGAVLSRAVIGATPMDVALAASFIIVALHRLVGWVSARHTGFDALVGGRAADLLRHGHLDDDRMRKTMITREDVLSNLRNSLHAETLADVERVVLERDGKLTFVRAGKARTGPARPESATQAAKVSP